MKLRNKKTGEIIEWEKSISYKLGKEYKSLAELNAEWEDYEEPVKPYWFVNDLDGKPMKCDLINCGKSNFVEWSEYRKQIGNYFSSREEAEKAVEKLKAWKMLKDKGFRFTKWTIPEEPKTTHIKLSIEAEMDVPDSPYDLDLLFSREDG